MRHWGIGVAAAAALLYATGAAAVCNDTRGTCFMIEACMSDLTPSRADARALIFKGLSEPHNNGGHFVWLGCDAIQVDLGHKKGWDKTAGGCSDSEYLDLAQRISALGRAACDQLPKIAVWNCGQPKGARYTYIGQLKPVGICDGAYVRGAPCSCGVLTGSVFLEYK